MKNSRAEDVNRYLRTRQKWIVLYSIVYAAGMAFSAGMFGRLIGYGESVSLPAEYDVTATVIARAVYALVIILGGLTVFSPVINLAAILSRGLVCGFISVMLSPSYSIANSTADFVLYIAAATSVAACYIMSCSEASCLWAYSCTRDMRLRDVYNKRVMPPYIIRQTAFGLLSVVMYAAMSMVIQ